MTVTIRLLLLLTLALLASVTAAAQRPNIILILCDDLGYVDVGFNGSPDIETPSLDRLAKAGTICTSAYVVHPFCGPSRMGMMAGRYPHKFGAPFNLPNSGQGYEAFNRKGIPVGETLLSTTLQNAGYFTGVMGKWHMGIDPQFHPNRRGFDDFYGFLGGGHEYFPEKYVATYERQKKAGKESFNEYILPLQHNGVEVKETEYMTDAISREGVRFVREAAQKDSPFFLYLAYNAPHMPLQAKQEDLAKFASIKDEKRRTYAAMVYAVDRGVGELTKSLEQTGQLQNTLIVFLSDNGGKLGVGGANNGPLRQGKGSVCEGGIRVPMLLHWPNQVPAGHRYNHPVSAIDFYPTFAGLANAEVPAGQKLDGKDIWEDFLADRSPRQSETLFAMRHHAGFSNVGVRRDQWKANCIGKTWQLYDLESDIAESTDVSAQQPELLDEMISEAKQWASQHTQPEWFDNDTAAVRWKANGMPNHQLLFPN